MYIAAYALSFIVFFVCARYRVPLIPFYIIFASSAIVYGVERLKKKQYKQLYIPVTIFIGSYLFFNANIFNIKQTNPGLNYCTLGVAYKNQGDIDKAVECYNTAIKVDPAQVRQVVMNLIINASEAIGDAPGVISVSTGVMECDASYLNDNNPRRGNSLSGPQVAGICALMLSANPDLPPWRVKELLESTARDLKPRGKDNETGAGLVNAFKAVRAAIRERRRQ